MKELKPTSNSIQVLELCHVCLVLSAFRVLAERDTGATTGCKSLHEKLSYPSPPPRSQILMVEKTGSEKYAGNMRYLMQKGD